MFDFGLTFSDILMTGQNPNCTSIAWAMFSTCYLIQLISALHENQQPASEAGAVIGANHDGVFQAPDNIQNSFDSLLNFGSNEYHYGLSGFTPSQSSLSVLGAAVLGGPSHASGARLVVYNKDEVIINASLDPVLSLKWFLQRPLMRDPSSIVETSNSSSRFLSLRTTHRSTVLEYLGPGLLRGLGLAVGELSSIWSWKSWVPQQATL